MDSSLLDQNTVSIIRSPNKQFYHMAALDSNDLEHFCGPGEYKLPDNGHHSNDMVNGWHRHSSEQVASDNVAAIRNYKLSEQLPNNEMNCICYPPSSGLQLSINRKITSIDLLNSNLAVGQADSFPPIPNTSSEAYLLVDDNEHNSIASLEGKLHGNQGHSNNDIVNTRSMTELSDPASVHHESEGCYNPAHVKPKRSPRKSVKKSKPSYNNCNNSWKNCGQRLNSETEDSKQYNIQMKSEISSEDVISNGFSVQPCSSPLSSCPTLCCYVNTEVNSKSENSYGKRDSGSSGNEEGVTSGVASTGHESTAIDQIWDGYQVNLIYCIHFTI